MQEEPFVERSDLKPRETVLLPSEPRRARTETEFTVRDFAWVIYKRRRVVAYFVAGVVLVTLIGLIFAKPQYRVAAKILVKKGRAEVPLSSRDSTQLIISQVLEEDLNTEIQILTSREVIEGALEGMGPRSPKVTTNWWQEAKASWGRYLPELTKKKELSYLDQMTLQVNRKLDVKKIERSNMIEVGYTSDDPEWATEFVGALTESYIAHRSRIFRTPGALPFFEEQMSAAAERLAEAEEELQSRLAEAGLTLLRGEPDPLGRQKELMLQNLGHLEEQLVNSRVELKQWEGRVATLRTGLATESERMPSSKSDNQDQAVEELERTLVELKLERDALVQSFSPTSRWVHDIDEQIRLAEEHLDEAEVRAGGINRTEINPVYLDGKSDLFSADAELQGARERYRSLLRQLAAYREVVAELNRQSLTLSRLSREAGLAEETYLLYRKKHEEARISASMDEQRLVNIAVAQPARAPLESEGPARRVKFLLAIMLALAGGVALALLVEQFDNSPAPSDELVRRRRYPNSGDLELERGIGHLATIPKDT